MVPWLPLGSLRLFEDRDRCPRAVVTRAAERNGTRAVQKLHRLEVYRSDGIETVSTPDDERGVAGVFRPACSAAVPWYKQD